MARDRLLEEGYSQGRVINGVIAMLNLRTLAFVAASRITIAVPRLGDIDLDGDVDYLDLLRIVPALGNAASGPNDLRNINGDAKIDFQDLVALSKLCTRRLCAAK